MASSSVHLIIFTENMATWNNLNCYMPFVSLSECYNKFMCSSIYLIFFCQLSGQLQLEFPTMPNFVTCISL
jgi:hypothetical protein